MAIKLRIKKKVEAPDPAPLVAKPKANHRPLDGMCRVAVASGKNGRLSWWLMASYLYYVHDLSLLTDELYDELAKDLLKDWKGLTHPHLHLVTEEDLKAGSLYRLPAKAYPAMVRGAAAHLARGEWGVSLNEQRDVE